MPKLRVLSGREVLKILSGFGFQDFAQRGSHIKLRRILPAGRRDPPHVFRIGATISA
jgi:predicted RNA binding protein YcfA (HicA-like mRNA interferase family)